MTTTRFDPKLGVDYGVCVTCGIPIPTSTNSASHLRETLPKTGLGRGHRISVINPDRDQRIEHFVLDALDLQYKGYDTGFNEIYGAVDAGDLTLEEATKAIRFASVDLESLWDEWVGEDQ